MSKDYCCLGSDPHHSQGIYLLHVASVSEGSLVGGRPMLRATVFGEEVKARGVHVQEVPSSSTTVAAMLGVRGAQTDIVRGVHVR